MSEPSSIKRLEEWNAVTRKLVDDLNHQHVELRRILSGVKRDSEKEKSLTALEACQDTAYDLEEDLTSIKEHLFEALNDIRQQLDEPRSVRPVQEHAWGGGDKIKRTPSTRRAASIVDSGIMLSTGSVPSFTLTDDVQNDDVDQSSYEPVTRTEEDHVVSVTEGHKINELKSPVNDQREESSDECQVISSTDKSL